MSLSCLVNASFNTFSPFYFHLHRYEASRLGRVGDDDDIHLIDQYFLRIITFGWSHLILTKNNSDIIWKPSWPIGHNMWDVCGGSLQLQACNHVATSFLQSVIHEWIWKFVNSNPMTKRTRTNFTSSTAHLLFFFFCFYSIPSDFFQTHL